MARQRQAKTETSAGSAEFTCPECGKTFSRAASLGAHRQRAHGVAGASKKTASRVRANSAKAQATPSGPGRRRGPAARSSTRTGANGTEQQKRDGHGGVNRDQLLQTLFPNGVPPQEAVIRQVGSWLDEAERLANLKR